MKKSYDVWVVSLLLMLLTHQALMTRQSNYGRQWSYTVADTTIANINLGWDAGQ